MLFWSFVASDIIYSVLKAVFGLSEDLVKLGESGKMTVLGTFEAVLAITYQEDIREICLSKYFQYVILIVCGLGRYLFGFEGHFWSVWGLSEIGEKWQNDGFWVF